MNYYQNQVKNRRKELFAITLLLALLSQGLQICSLKIQLFSMAQTHFQPRQLALNHEAVIETEFNLKL